jgi:hypothetical protein
MESNFCPATLLVCSLFFAGCIDDSASYQIGGSDHALTLIRMQPYFWQEDIEVSMVVTRLPECQRRHPLDRGGLGGASIELYETDAQKFLLREGKQWYSIESENCSLEGVDAPKSDAQGALKGKFEEDENQRLSFVDAAPLQEK